MTLSSAHSIGSSIFNKGSILNNGTIYTNEGGLQNAGKIVNNGAIIINHITNNMINAPEPPRSAFSPQRGSKVRPKLPLYSGKRSPDSKYAIASHLRGSRATRGRVVRSVKASYY